MDSDWDYNANIMAIEAFDDLLLEENMKNSRKRKASRELSGMELKNPKSETEVLTLDSVITG